MIKLKLPENKKKQNKIIKLLQSKGYIMDISLNKIEMDYIFIFPNTTEFSIGYHKKFIKDSEYDSLNTLIKYLPDNECNIKYFETKDVIIDCEKTYKTTSNSITDN